MVDYRLKNLEGTSRRHFLRWTTAVGAALAVDRSEILNVISDSAGTAIAEEAGGRMTMLSAHLIAGDGGIAWFTQLWPHVEIAQAGSGSFAWYAPGQGQLAADSDKPLFVGPATPWQTYGKSKQISAFMAGVNETHTQAPNSPSTLGGNGLMAACASIQRATPSLLPVIAVEPFDLGVAPGVPAAATVGDADGLVGLFNSAASRAILEVPSDAALFEGYYKAFLGLKKASTRATQLRGLNIGKQSANFLGQNLAAKLTPTADDLVRYGIDGGTATNVAEIGKTLIIGAKAFRLGITQMIALPAMRDDPHEAFSNMANLETTVMTLRKIFDGFMDDLANSPDPINNARNLSDAIVMTVHGDTPKDPLNRGGWPDNTPDNSNWIYVLGNGFTKTGWHGGVKANGNVDGFDPTTGATVANQQSNTTTDAAGAAVAFAVARGDGRRVQDFGVSDINSIGGIININPLQ